MAASPSIPHDLALPAALGRGLATEARVHAACDHLFAAGSRITEPAVRALVGGGSKTSIYAHVETWYGRLQDEVRELRAGAGAPAMPDLPTPLLDALRAIWGQLAEAAHASAAAALQAQQDALVRDRAAIAEEIERERERLTADRERWAEERDALVSGRDEALRAQVALRDRAGDLKHALALAEERLTTASAQLAAAVGRTRELEATLLEASERHARDTAELLVRFDAERHALTRDLAIANTARAASDARALEERQNRLALAAECTSLQMRLGEARSALRDAEAALATQAALASEQGKEIAALRATAVANAPQSVAALKRRARGLMARRKRSP